MSKRRKRFNTSKGKKISNLDRDILQFLNQNPNKLFNYKQIAAKLNVNSADGRNQVIRELHDLKSQARVEEVERGKFILVPKSHYHAGIVEVTSRGNAYVVCDDLEHDIYIPSRNLNHALNNDVVRVYVYKRKKNKKQDG